MVNKCNKVNFWKKHYICIFFQSRNGQNVIIRGLLGKEVVVGRADLLYDFDYIQVVWERT